MKAAQRARFVENHLPLVRHLAARTIRWAWPFLEMDDLVAIGAEALLHASERYDPRRGMPFGTFAYLRVRGAMLEGIGLFGPFSRGAVRDRKGRPERPALPTVVHLEEEEVAREGGPTEVERVASAIDTARMAPRLTDAIDALDDHDRQIILRHYFGGDTLKEIGREMGHSRSWASRVHSRALSRLRSALEPALAVMSREPSAARAA